MNRFSYIFLSFPLTFKECLFHALKQKKYNVVAALVFVMDRFTYWQGSSHTTLQLVDYLKANSPDTPIAPQLLIRKVRIMKNAGDLQGNYQNNALTQEMEKVSFSCAAFAFHTCEPRQRKRKCKKGI